MSAQYSWLTISNLALNGLSLGGVLIITWIGWLRTRRIAWLILGIWALSVMVGIGFQTFYFQFAYLLMGSAVSSQHQQELFSWLLLLRSLISSALALTGFGMLVFGSGVQDKTGRA